MQHDIREIRRHGIKRKAGDLIRKWIVHPLSFINLHSALCTEKRSSDGKGGTGSLSAVLFCVVQKIFTLSLTLVSSLFLY